MIFDEPTTVLIPQEIQDLFTTIRSLTAEGKGIVLITHKLDELLEITDRITVLRASRSSGTLRTADVDGQTLARLMVGRDVQLRTTAAFVGLDTDPAATATARILDRSGPPALSLQGIGVVDHGVHRLTGITLDVARDEILGVAGVEGNGQRKLVEVLCGTRPASEGTMQVHRNDVTSAGPVGLRAVGVRIMTEDRHATGCVLDMTVGENLLCDRIGDAPYSRAGIIARRSADDAARVLIRDYRVKTPGPGTPMRALSGGNQQRAILARELSRPVDVLVAAQPTRGLDVGAIEEVTERINAARDGGAAALLVSSDLTEILALSDRVSVIYRGEIVGVLDRADAHHDRLGELMAGLVLALVAGFAGGGAWSAIAGWLKARLGVNEVIATLLLNYIAINATEFLVDQKGLLRDRDAEPQSAEVLGAARLGRLLPHSVPRLRAGVIMAVIAALPVWFLLRRTVPGFRIRMLGHNAAMAARSGVSLRSMSVRVMFAAGGLAGLAGSSMLLGEHYRLRPNFSPGYGFDGIAVALIANNNPLAAIPAALLFGVLRAGGNLLEAKVQVPQSLAIVIQGTIIFAVAGMAFLLRRQPAVVTDPPAAPSDASAAPLAPTTPSVPA